MLAPCDVCTCMQVLCGCVSPEFVPKTMVGAPAYGAMGRNSCGVIHSTLTLAGRGGDMAGGAEFGMKQDGADGEAGGAVAGGTAGAPSGSAGMAVLPGPDNSEEMEEMEEW